MNGSSKLSAIATGAFLGILTSVEMAALFLKSSEISEYANHYGDMPVAIVSSLIVALPFAIGLSARSVRANWISYSMTFAASLATIVLTPLSTAVVELTSKLI